MKSYTGVPLNTGITVGKLLYCSGSDTHISFESTTAVLYAKELTPTQILEFSASTPHAFILQVCTDTSHAAILIRNTDMPSLSGIELPETANGKTVIVDGYEGLLILDPDKPTLAAYRKKQEEMAEKKANLTARRETPTVTKSGRSVQLYANINRPEDVTKAMQNGADGLFFKTEFMFLSEKEPLSEEEQFCMYRHIAESMAGRPVIIRTADIGADKIPAFLPAMQEENPALGVRGIRFSFTQPHLLFPQLRALLRASIFGDVRLMLPMVTDVGEIYRAKEYLARAAAELETEGIPCRNKIPVGIMIETPAAAIMSDLLAKEVDFFSIGTNDLTQYVLAADRQNPHLASLYSAKHPAVLKLLQHTVKNAHCAGITVSISGELGADPTATETLLADGIDILAVSPAKIPLLKEQICQMK